MVLERCKQRLELLFKKLLVDNKAAALEATYLRDCLVVQELDCRRNEWVHKCSIFHGLGATPHPQSLGLRAVVFLTYPGSSSLHSKDLGCVLYK